MGPRQPVARWQTYLLAALVLVASWAAASVLLNRLLPEPELPHTSVGRGEAAADVRGSKELPREKISPFKRQGGSTPLDD